MGARESKKKDNQIVWLDPEVRGEDNYSWHQELMEFSNHPLICITDPEDLVHVVQDTETYPNIILISCGSKYPQIREMVESSINLFFIRLYI